MTFPDGYIEPAEESSIENYPDNDIEDDDDDYDEDEDEDEDDYE